MGDTVFGTRTSQTPILENFISGNRVGVDIYGGSQVVYGNTIAGNKTTVFRLTLVKVIFPEQDNILLVICRSNLAFY